MRFIHTADWHLGKTLKNQSLIDDQIHILDEFLKIVDNENIDAVVIAGDVYDRSIPSEDAVNIFNEILIKLLIERRIPVLCIAGNHDSANRLNFGSRIFDYTGFHIRAKINKNLKPITLNDDYGEIYFSLIPYFEPVNVRKRFNIEQHCTFNEAGEIIINAARSQIPSNKRCIAVAHAFIAGGVSSESERPLSVGGADNISPKHFNTYNYTALGHLHSPQRIGANNIRYSGSLLKYSFDEWKQHKCINIIDIDRHGNTTIDEIPLTPLHDVRIITGELTQLLELPRSEDYIQAVVVGNPVNARVKLLDRFPNLLALEKTGITAALSTHAEVKENISAVELFKAFVKDTSNEDLNSDELAVLTEIIKQL